MKFLAALLSVLILFLSLSAGVSDSCLPDDECETEQSETENHSSDCPDCCSPFSLCNTCAGFTFAPAIHSQTKQLEFNTKELILYVLQLYTSPLVDSVWQPPQA